MPDASTPQSDSDRLNGPLPSSTPARHRIPLSVPHVVGTELQCIREAIESNWIASVGPDVDRFEEEFARLHQVESALATSSGTSALHLALRVLGIRPGDEVFVSTLTFCASVNPALYLGARPVFVDSESRSWNLDAQLLASELDRRGRAGRLPAAVVVVQLYGQMAEMTPILAACDRWGIPVVEDAAEALGAWHHEGGTRRAAGTMGTLGLFSFDGSKMISTSVGGMLISSRPELIQHARKLARQAREPVPHYEHTEIGYNYRMSNLLAAFGRAQLGALESRVAQRRRVHDWYREGLHGVPGVRLQEEAPWGTHSRWLTCALVDAARAGVDRVAVGQALLQLGIESRPVWKPMHQQPVYRALRLESIGGGVADGLFAAGLCLPSSSSLSRGEVDEVCSVIRECVRDGR